MEELKKAFGSIFGDVQITGVCYVKIKAKNPEKLAEAFTSFFETLKQSLMEFLPEFSDYFESQVYEVSETADGVIIGFDVMTQAMLSPQLETMYAYVESTCELKPITSFEIALGSDLHTVKTIQAGKANLLTEIAKDMKVLLRVRANGNVMAQNMEVYRILNRNVILKEDEKLPIEIFNALFHSAKFRLILSKADNYEILKN